MKTYDCCKHCGGLGDPYANTDDPIDGLPAGCIDAPHEEPYTEGCDD